MPATSPQPAPLPVTPGWHRAAGGGGGARGSVLHHPDPLPTLRRPSAASGPRWGPRHPWVLRRQLRGRCAPVPRVPGGVQGCPCPCGTPVLAPGVPRSAVELRPGGVPVLGRGGNRSGQGSEAGAAPGEVAAAPGGRVRGGARRGCPVPEPSGRRWGQPGWGGRGQRTVPSGTRGSRYRGPGRERVPLPGVRPNREEWDSARKGVPGVRLCRGTEQVPVPAAQG